MSKLRRAGISLFGNATQRAMCPEHKLDNEEAKYQAPIAKPNAATAQYWPI